MGRITDWISSLFSISSPGSASKRQSKAEQGDAEAQHKHGLSNVDSLEPDKDGIYDLREKENSDLAPVVMLVNYILAEAIKRGASEIHIDSNEDNFWFSYRIDGILNLIMIPPKRLQNAVINRVKIMAKLEIWKRQLPHDGKIGVRVDGRAHSLRVSTCPDRYGEKVVIQIPDSANVRSDGDNQNQPGWDKIDVDELMRKFISSIFRVVGVP